MLAFALYSLTAAPLLYLCSRFVRPVTLTAALILYLLPLCFTGYAIFIDGVYGPIDHPYQSEPLASLRTANGIGAPYNINSTDAYAQMFPWRKAVRDSLLRGEWPLWNPYGYCGHLLAGNAQSAAWSPFTLIASLIPAAKSFVYTASIAFFLAALGTFIFLGEIGCSDGAALIGAAGFVFSTSVVLYVLVPMGFAWTLFPFVLASARRVVHAPGVRAFAMLTTALTLSFLSGHPESVVLLVFVGSVYALFEILRLRVNPSKPVLVALAAGVVTLALCAIYLLPFLEALPQTSEIAYKSEVWGNERRGFAPNVISALLANDLFPYLYMHKWAKPDLPLLQAESWAAGSLLLALALFAVVRKRSAQTWFFFAMFVLSVVNAVQWAPVANALQHLPLLRITHLERLAFAGAFFLCVLAACGIDEVLRHRRAAAITLTIVFVALAIGTIWTRQAIVLAPVPDDYGHFAIFAELFFLGAAAALFASRAPARVIVPSLFAALLAQRALTNGDVHRTFPAAAAYPHLRLLEKLEHQSEPFRVVGRGYALIPGTNAFYGIEDPRGYEGVTFRQFEETWRLWSVKQPVWFNRVDDLSRPFLSFANVRYAIDTNSEQVPDGWKKIATEGGAMLLENTRVLPRVFVPRRVSLGLPDAMQLFGMQETADFRERAWITTDTPPQERENGPGTVVVRQWKRGGEYRIEANMQRGGWIVISDTAWKGWRAYIDGRRVEMQRANTAFNSVYVPAGHHEVRVKYWPASFVLGRAVSLGTLLLLALWTAATQVAAFHSRSKAAAPEAYAVT